MPGLLSFRIAHGHPLQECHVVGLQPLLPLPALGDPPQSELAHARHDSGLAQGPARPQVAVLQQGGVVGSRLIWQALERQGGCDVIHTFRVPPTATKAHQSAPTAAKAHKQQPHPQPKRFAAAFGSLLRLLPFAMATTIATGCTAVSPAPVPCEVLSAVGQRINDYELLGFRDDGLLTIRSTRTGTVRQLPPERWLDPIEVALLEAAAAQA